MAEDITKVVAGLLSTIDFNPSERHPESMLPMAERIVRLISQIDAGALSELRAITDDVMIEDKGVTWNRLDDVLISLGRP